MKQQVYNQEQNNYQYEDQNRVLSLSLIIAGLGFLLIAGLGFAIANLIKSDNISVTWLYVALICGMVSIIMSFIWTFRFTRASFTFIAVVYFTFIFSMSFGLGILFTYYSISEIFTAFVITGSVATVAGTCGWFIKSKKAMFGMVISALITELLFMIIGLILMGSGKVHADSFLFMTTMIGVVVSFIYIMFDLFLIRRSSMFMNMNPNSNHEQYKIAAFFGFRLLMDFIRLFQWILILMRR